MGGGFLMILGVWVACQVTRGGALDRLGIIDAITGKSSSSSTSSTKPSADTSSASSTPATSSTGLSA